MTKNNRKHHTGRFTSRSNRNCHIENTPRIVFLYDFIHKYAYKNINIFFIYLTDVLNTKTIDL